jgi:hypothetical protein
MYIHLGMGVMVPKADIVAVFDLDNSSQSYLTRDYLKLAEKRGQVTTAAEDLPKSFVVCAAPGGRQQVYLSQLSSATLLKRSDDLGVE